MITATVIVSFIAALKDRPASRVPTPPISATSASGTPPGSRPLIRDLEFCASCTSLTICARAVLAPILVVFIETSWSCLGRAGMSADAELMTKGWLDLASR